MDLSFTQRRFRPEVRIHEAERSQNYAITTSTLLATALFTSVGEGAMAPDLLSRIRSAPGATTSAENLSLQGTYIKTGGPLNLSDFSSGLQEAVPPTTIKCPKVNKTTCTVRIELSSEFSNVTPDTVAAAAVLVDDSPDGIAPSNVAGFDSTSTTGASNVRTFSWVKTGLNTGDHVIEMFLFTSSVSGTGSAGSFMRTLTIQVYTSAAN